MSHAASRAPASAPVAVLLVDDRPANLLALEAVLASPERELVVASSGREAVALVKERDFAVVLLDVQMPGMDGFETAAQLRALARDWPVPIIFVTGIDASPPRIMRGYAEGAVDFIQKPLDPEIIRAKVSVFEDLFRARRRLVSAQTQVASESALRAVAETRLQASEERFRLLVETVRDYAIFLLDPQGRVASWNAGAKRFKGYEAEEILGKHFSIFYPRQDVEAGICDRWLEIAAREGRFEDEGWRVRKDGSRFWAHVIITALHDPRSGALVGFAKVTRDLTNQRRAEEERLRLAEEAARREAAERSLADFRTLIDHLPVLAWTALPDGHVDFYNLRWFEFTGTTPEEMAGWGWQRVHDPAVLPAVLERWKHALATGEPFEMEFPLRGADGAYRWFLTRVSPHRDPQGAIVRWVGINTDIDARRRAEEARDAARSEAERQRDRAERAVRAREDLLAIVSHDLRNPLGVVLLGAAQVERHADESAAGRRVKSAATSILAAADRMTRLVGDLLDLAKLEAGQALPLDREIADVGDVTRRATELLEPLARTRQLTLDARVSGQTAALCDRGRVEQVLSNLIGNAMKFTRQGGAIRVEARRAGSDVLVSVSDTGIGIPEDQARHVFEPYWQAGPEKKQGAGLGLSICKAIVDAHGGRLWVESAVGRGSTFYFTLPATDGAASSKDGT